MPSANRVVSESVDRQECLEERKRNARLCIQCSQHKVVRTLHVCTLFPFAFSLVTGEESYAECEELRAIGGACGHDGTFFCAKPKSRRQHITPLSLEAARCT